MNNPMEMIKTLMSGGKTPQDIVMQMVGNNNNPMLNNLIKMAKEGNTQGVENFARNMFKEQGRDFDAEMQKLQNLVNSFK